MAAIKKTQPKLKPVKRGRPPLPGNISRSVRVVTFLSEPEKLALDCLVQEKSSSVSAVCHDILSRGLKDTQSN
jgi:hypothetical protein